MREHLERSSRVKDPAVSTPYRLKYMVPPFCDSLIVSRLHESTSSLIVSISLIHTCTYRHMTDEKGREYLSSSIHACNT